MSLACDSRDLCASWGRRETFCDALCPFCLNRLSREKNTLFFIILSAHQKEIHPTTNPMKYMLVVQDGDPQENAQQIKKAGDTIENNLKSFISFHLVLFFKIPAYPV